MLAENELLMCTHYSENCLKRTPIGLKGVHFRENFQEMSSKWREHISRAEPGGRNIPLTTNLIRLLTWKLFGLSIKAEKKFKKTKFLSDVSMSTVKHVP